MATQPPVPPDTSAGSPAKDPNDDAQPRVSTEALVGLQLSYKEVLDATKHQDDKIGRLFTGVSFLTAAALAVANLSSAQYVTREYPDVSGLPLGVLSLACYLFLVLLCVMLLINSLATPLRTPGLAARKGQGFQPDYVSSAQASQIYFGTIARITVKEWHEKWLAPTDRRDQELAQSLVLETHNIAARTQFKYHRTTEAVTLFNLALMFLWITLVLCINAAVSAEGSELSAPSRLAVAAAVGVYIFVYFAGQIRYSRQTIEELAGPMSTPIALFRYLWAAVAAAWGVLVGSGLGDTGTLVLVCILGIGCLLSATILERRRNNIARREQPLHWAVLGLALIIGLGLSFLSRHGGYAYALGSAVLGGCAVTGFALSLPTITTRRDARKYRGQSFVG